MLPQQSTLFPLPRPGVTYTVGIVGSCPFDIGARRHLDAFVQSYAIACHGMHILVGCQTRFEQRTLLRLGVLKRLFPKITVTLLAADAWCELARRMSSSAPRSEIARLAACADEIRPLAEAEAYPWTADCDVVIDACAPISGCKSAALRHAAGRVFPLKGAAMSENLVRMEALAAACGLVPPGRLAEDCKVGSADCAEPAAPHGFPGLVRR